MADFSAVALSAGLSLLSKGTISNFTPAGFLALTFSAKNCQVFSWLAPTGAIRPLNGSIQAILTVWPCWAKAAPAAHTMAAVTSGFTKNFMHVSCYKN